MRLRLTALFVVAGALLGCIDSELLRCGEFICPPGSVCTADGLACVDLNSRCGNGVQDDGEVCDDGNKIPGDGCYFECQSNETCGNGIVDAIAGELCDTDIDLRGDGCDLCLPSVPFWYFDEEVPGRLPITVAHHTHYGKTFAFGGQVASMATNELLEWSSDRWVVLAGAVSPSKRYFHAMAYDAEAHELVMFGGAAGKTAPPPSTWLWRGQWRPVMGDNPGNRSEHSMAYDGTRDVVVLFGGTIPMAQGPTNDTWLWDGATWTPADLPADQRPPGLALQTMAYDPPRAAVVMCGGVTGPPLTPSNECWSWDGAAWTLLATPSPSNRGAMAFDPKRGQLVHVHQLDAAALKTCAFVGGGWDCVDKAIVGADPRDIGPAALTYDTRLQALLLVSSIDQAPPSPDEFGTWVERNGSWEQVKATPPPLESSLNSYVSYYDPGRGKSVFQGDGGILEFDGVRLYAAHTTSPTDYRNDASMALDPLGHGVLFGGTLSGMAAVALSDTFVWDGTTWKQATPSLSPPGRTRAAMAYDSVNAATVLFGGKTTGSPASFYSDTWLWDGANWTEVSGDAPPARANAMMAYDRVHEEVVLFGGQNSESNRLGDTWVWDGVEWNPAEATASPPARILGVLVYDPNRRRVVLHGGVDGFGVTLRDTWEWDGGVRRWVQVGVESLSPERSNHAATYHALSARTVSYGGVLPGEEGDGLLLHTYGLNQHDDRCDLAIDIDGDGLSGCGESSCWARCTPWCVPTEPGADCDESRPHCGDGDCNDDLESWLNCPSDCPVPDICGDFACTGVENASTCPGDCS